MSDMPSRSILFLVIFFVLTYVSDQAPPKNRNGDGSGELPPDLFGSDKNMRVPPFGDPVLTGDDFDEYSFNTRINNRRTPPPDYEYKGPVDSDYGNDFSSPGKKPEINPDFDKDERPFEGPGIKEDDNEIVRNGEDEDSGIDKSGSKDYDKPQEGETDYSFEDKNWKVPVDEGKVKHDEDVDESRDDEHGLTPSPKYDDDDDIVDKPKNDDDNDDDIDKPKDDDEDHDSVDEPKDDDDDHDVVDVSKDDEDNIDDVDKPKDDDDDIKSVDEPKDDDDDIKSVDEPKDGDDEENDSDKAPDDYPGAGNFHGGIIFDTPFFNVRQVSKYFQQLEKALEQVFRQSMDEALLLNGTYANTTEEEVEIDGHKYIVQKSIIKGKNNDSSIYVEALSTLPKTNKTEEAKEGGL